MAFIISSSPHINSKETTSKIMFSVFFALIPAGIWGILKFGVYSAVVIFTSVLSCVLFEFISQRYIFKTKIRILDGSSILIGLLMAYCLPTSVKIWQIFIGSFFAIVLAKESFGGTGYNIFNPALIGMAVIRILFPADMVGVQVDGITQATPLGIMKWNVDMQLAGFTDLFIGNIQGSIGEVSKLLLILGAVYLFLKRIISWHIPAMYISTVFILSAIFKQNPISQILSGGLILGAFFMATDYVTSPIFARGKIIFGIGCGLLTFSLRKFGIFTESVGYSILIMNLSVPLLDGFNFKKDFMAMKINIKKYVYIFFLVSGILYIATNLFSFKKIHISKPPDKSIIFKEVLPMAADFIERENYTEGLDENKRIIGYILIIKTEGYSGQIDAIFGVDNKFKITGIKIISQNETPGVGSRIEEKDFLNQFTGKLTEECVIKEDGGKIDAVTSATISSRAITDAIREKMAIFLKHVKR